MAVSEGGDGEMSVSVDPGLFRAAMARFPGAVTIITARHGDERRGITATAVCSVSTDPPSLLACVNRNTGTCVAIAEQGRFNNNVLTMAAGYAALSQVFTPQAADDLYARGEALKGELNWIAREKGKSLQVTGTGSIMCIHSVDGPVRTPADVVDPLPERGKLLHLEMFMRGFAFAQRGYISLNLAMTDDDMSEFTQAFAEVINLHGAFWE